MFGRWRELSNKELVEMFCKDLCKELDWLEAELLKIEDIGIEKFSTGYYEGYRYYIELRGFISLLHLKDVTSAMYKIRRKYKRYGAVIEIPEQEITCSYLLAPGLILRGYIWFKVTQSKLVV